MNPQQVLEKLIELQDTGYQAFHAGLVPGKNRIIGVRMPDLHRLAKVIVKDGPEAFLRTCPHDWYEQDMLYGMVLGKADFPIEKVLEELDRFLPYVDNWAVCDCTANGLRVIGKEKAAAWDWTVRCLQSGHPFTVRFGICILMGYYLDAEHIDRVLDLFAAVRREDYYVNMGLSWALCECLVRHYDKTLPLLSQKSLPPWVQNKTIQKAVESYRITAEQKAVLRSFKIKPNK